MHPFSFVEATDPAGALGLMAERQHAAFIAGGTNLLDLMKEGAITPQTLIDIRSLEALRGIELRAGILRIGALEVMSDVAANPLVRREFPALCEALLASASAQIRNMASIGGNLLQRTRCGYFRDVAFPCNKRRPGSGCPAIGGVSRTHAILGTSSDCIASHPSDLAVALVAFDASLIIGSANGERAMRLERCYRTPKESPQMENHLERGELILAVEIPILNLARTSHYLKVRDRASYEFALVSAAVGIEWSGDMMNATRVAFGGIGTKPWRSHEAEAELKGATWSEDTVARAAAAATRDAKTTAHNAFKIDLVHRTLKRAIDVLRARR